MNAPRNGVYVLNGCFFYIRQGDPLPNGAVMEPEDEPAREAAPVEKRAQKAAPENKAMATERENR